LWITGGMFANWDDDYTFNKWFSENSLTDLRSMASPYLALGLEYAFNDDIVLGAGIMNSGFNTFAPHYNADNNRYKSFYTRLEWENLYRDWNLLFSCLTGNEADVDEERVHITEIYTLAGGPITDKLEAQIAAKFFRDSVNLINEDPFNTFTFQTSLRYRVHEKFAAGATFSFNSNIHNLKGINVGIVGEYNPTPFTYLRLEGGWLSFAGANNKVFNNGSKDVSSRLSVALSLGFKFEFWKR